MEKITTRVITVAATVIVVNAANGLKITGSSRSVLSHKPEVELVVQLQEIQQTKDALIVSEDLNWVSYGALVTGDE